MRSTGSALTTLVILDSFQGRILGADSIFVGRFSGTLENFGSATQGRIDGQRHLSATTAAGATVELP